MATVLLIDDIAEGVRVFTIAQDDARSLLEKARRRNTAALGSLERDIQAHSLIRWSTIVVGAVSSKSDVTTLREWGRAVGVSVGALRNWCLTAGIPARQSLIFARLLRAIVRQKGGSVPPEYLLNIVDRRTLVKVLVAAGGTRDKLPVNVDEFCSRQKLVANKSAVEHVRELVTRLV